MYRDDRQLFTHILSDCHHRLPATGADPLATWRYGRDYSCTMVAWAGHKDRISLDRLCMALRVPSPKADGIDGSKVGDLWAAGDLESIRQYNKADCAAVRACWERMEMVRGAA